MSNAGANQAAPPNPKPAPEVVMAVYDGLPPRIRAAVRDAGGDVDPRAVAALLARMSEDAVLQKLEQLERSRKPAL